MIQKVDSTYSDRDKEHEQVVLTPHSTEVNHTRKGFITPPVGDVGTCKTNAAVISRSAAFNWIGICPGDLHNKRYFCEAVYKALGSSGLHYLLVKVLKRSKLTAEVFKDKKFNDDNLIRVRECIQDGCKAYGLAAVFEFTKSKYFPTQNELSECKIMQRSHAPILLDKFKEWLKECASEDKAFKERSEAFMFYGPLLSFYDECIHFGDGFGREIVYQLQLPVYAQLGFPNYYTECFHHIINFLEKWPLFTRLLLRDNCAVNLSGKTGCGIELDAYVESEVIKPLKRYASGHSTVLICERIIGNLDLFRSVRHIYKSKNGFDVHGTRRHSVQSVFQDQLKGAWFCLKNKILQKFRPSRNQVLLSNWKWTGIRESSFKPVTNKGKGEGQNCVIIYTKAIRGLF